VGARPKDLQEQQLESFGHLAVPGVLCKPYQKPCAVVPHWAFSMLSSAYRPSTALPDTCLCGSSFCFCLPIGGVAATSSSSVSQQRQGSNHTA
jgi:hypothetical protein